MILRNYSKIFVTRTKAKDIFWLKNRRPDKWREKPVAVEERAASPIDKITEEIFRLQQQEREAAENDPTEPNNE